VSCEETGRVVELARADLPPGWSCWKVQRLRDKTKWDHYLLSSEGRKFRSQKEVNEFITSENPELGQITFKVSNSETSMSEEKDSKPTAINRNLHQSCITTFFAQRTTANATMKVEPEIAGVPPIAVRSRSSSIDRTEYMEDGSSNSSNTDTNSNVLESDATNIVEGKKTADADAMGNEKDITVGGHLEAAVVKPTLHPDTDPPPILETKPAPEAKNVEEADGDCGSEASPKPEEVPPTKRKRGRPKKSAIEDKECPSSSKRVVKPKKQKIDPEKEKNSTNSEKDATEPRSEESDVCEFGKDELQYIKEIEEFMKKVDLNFQPKPPTKGDGNCWYRAAAAQVVIHDIPDQPRDHKGMRLQVSNHLKSLPEQVKKETIDIVFNGKKRGLSDLAHRQRKDGQWVDDSGIMALATAHLLKRNIHVYSFPSEGSNQAYSRTEVQGGQGADKVPPLNIFFSDKHYQSLS